MATTIIAADVISLGTNRQYTLGNTGDIFVLTSGTRLIADGYSFLFGTAPGINVTIDGYLWLEGNLGSPFYFSGGDDITIGPDAQMVLTSSTSLAALTLGVAFGSTEFVNYGHITTRGGPQGVEVGGGSNTLRNFGTIELTNGSFRYGSGANDTLLNAGVITGQTSSSAAIIAIFGPDNALTNTGDILTARLGGYGVVDNSNIGTTTIVNTGNIISGLGTGIGTNGANTVLTNSGTISGPNASLNLVGGNNTVINTGHLIGNVLFGAGNDTFRGIGGTVTGTVSGGAGNDSYFVSDPTLVILESFGGGDDFVSSTVNFRLAAEIEGLALLGAASRGIGNGLNNILLGNAGDDVLHGLGGMDNMAGDAGDDVMRGGDGNDTMQGNDGDDILRGGGGNDSLLGVADDDRLQGDAGRDTMAGGTGYDVFIFTRLTDSGTTAATADRITDFQRGQDVIGLAGIDARSATAANDAFAFIGTTAFSGVAGQLRYSTSSGVTTVLVDVNGDRTTDMALRLTGTLALTAQDFIL